MRTIFLWGLVAMAAWAMTACSDNPATSAEDQIQKLRDENAEVKRLEADNSELPRLQQEFKEMEQLKAQTRDIEKLRRENDELRAQISGKLKATQAAAEAQKLAAAQSATTAAAENADKPKSPEIPQEGDQIWVSPEALSAILPGLDTSTLKRKEPIMVNDLLQTQGIVITNYQQLRAMGITNYQIKRVPVKQ